MLLNQKLTLWEKTSDGFGVATYARRIVRCKFAHKQELYLAPNGDTILSKAVVYFSENLNVKDFIYLGESTEPEPNSEAHRLMAIASSPYVLMKKGWL